MCPTIKRENKILTRSLPTLIEMPGEGTVVSWPAAGKGKLCSNVQEMEVLKTWQIKHNQEIISGRIRTVPYKGCLSCWQKCVQPRKSVGPLDNNSSETTGGTQGKRLGQRCSVNSLYQSLLLKTLGRSFMWICCIVCGGVGFFVWWCLFVFKHMFEFQHFVSTVAGEGLSAVLQHVFILPELFGWVVSSAEMEVRSSFFLVFVAMLPRNSFHKHTILLKSLCKEQICCSFLCFLSITWIQNRTDLMTCKYLFSVYDLSACEVQFLHGTTQALAKFIWFAFTQCSWDYSSAQINPFSVAFL